MDVEGPPILELRDVSRRFASGGLFRRRSVIRAVDRVDLAIREGETFAIVGESGCGKSTLARLLVRLLPVSEGALLFRGREIGAQPERAIRHLRKDLQFVFQDPFSSLNPRMSVGEIIAEPIRLHRPGMAGGGALEARVVALLETVGLRAEHRDRYPHEFSGGQRQRVGIARALASQPAVIVADEPVSALDVSVQAQVINLLEDLKAHFGLTLVVIAHDLAVIRHMSDRVAVMYLGRIVEQAPAAALFERPRHPYTQALMSAIPLPVPGLRRSRVALAGDVPSPADPPPGCHFHTRCVHRRPRCEEERPDLEGDGEGGLVACHFWREIAPAAPLGRHAHGRTEGAQRRLALYRREQFARDRAARPPPPPGNGRKLP